jgi:hypothetical protein
MRNGAMSVRGALDEIEAYERFQAVAAQGAFNAAVAMVAVAFPPVLAVAPAASAAATAFGTAVAPTVVTPLAAEVAAAGFTEMSQVWFASVTGGNAVAQRRDLKDRFRARVSAFARARSFDAIATETLINTFDNALDY